MTVEDVVLARLLSLTTLTAMTSTRMYLGKLPQSPTYPAVKVFAVDDIGEGHLRGGGGVLTARIQVDCYAREVSGVNPKALANAVSDAVRGPGDGTALDGWVEAVGSPVFWVLGCLFADRHEGYDETELRVYTVSQDFMVSYRA